MRYRDEYEEPLKELPILLRAENGCRFYQAEKLIACLFTRSIVDTLWVGGLSAGRC